MKNLLLVLSLIFASVSVTTSTHANWFGGSGNNREWKMGPNGPYWDESDWPEWTPMYWMEEFMDEFDNNNWGGNNWGGGNNFNYRAPYGAYNNINPYNYGMPYGGYTYPQQAPVAPSVPTQ